ncbi:MAG: hypothetical protein NWF00_01540 [Candidatus Bathyarchaeota archaeon]|nr:hypothetical protein [Candidatus Bathyarchaeota archaeon]
MSETENPAVTLTRMLKSNLRVVKDDGSLANIDVSGEWQNIEAFKGLDGQVTVGIAETVDQKLELSGKTRRRISALRVNVWVTEQPAAAESAKVLRTKIAEEVNRVVRENRSRPNQTRYDFYALGTTSQTHKAYWGTSEASPTDAGWTELASADYAKLWGSDDERCQVSVDGDGEVAALLFGFKVENREKTASGLALSFEGYGSSPSGSGVTMKAWNHVAGVWGQAQTGSAEDADEPVTVTFIQDLPSYIDEEGYVWCFAQTTGASNGETPAVLDCDYAACTVTVKGITYCDIVSYREADLVDVKPFIFRTEFNVKSWFFENIGV